MLMQQTSRPRLRCALSLATLLSALLLFNPPAAAQQSDDDDDPRPSECYGFSFGEWDPPLDWASAGHGAGGVPRQEAGPRDNAAPSGSDATAPLLLYPSFWPVGVTVMLPRSIAPGDTIRTTAVALVADGSVRAPRAPVRAWRVPCRKPSGQDTSR